MRFIAAVLLIGLAFLILFAVTGLGGWLAEKKSSTSKALDTERKARVDSERALNKAEQAFRRIANGAASPELEAQIALDEITSYHEKELN